MAFTPGIEVTDDVSLWPTYVTGGDGALYASNDIGDVTVDFGELYVTSGESAFYSSLDLGDPTTDFGTSNINANPVGVFTGSNVVSEYVLPVKESDDAFLIVFSGLQPSYQLDFEASVLSGVAPLNVRLTPKLYTWDIY